MTAASFLRDLAAFSVQIAVVVLVVAALLRVVRIPAGARYLCLRLTLLACLVVPWSLRSVVVVTHAPEDATRQPVNAQTTPGPAPTGLTLAPPSSTATAPPQVFPGVPWTTVGLLTLIVGVAARAAWLAIGFFRLGLLTRRAVPVESAEYALVQEQLGTAATISEVDRLAQPVTFGFRRPTVLLPDALAAAPAPLRRAVVTHELFHVRRGDWLSLLGEEAVRTVLWFHPAIHWLTSSIQLAREEMVDELTVRATGDRRAYMQALLAFADTGGLRAASAFAHRRQLFHRILSVSKEKVMSAPRIVMSVVALAAAAGGASWYASSLFPIVTARATAPNVRVALAPIWRSQGVDIVVPMVNAAASQRPTAAARPDDEIHEVTPENPIPRRIRGASPATPSQVGAPVDVVVNTLVRIGRDGAVSNVFDKGCSLHVNGRLLDRDAACSRFFESAASAIRQWRYDRPVRGPLQFTVAVTFRKGAYASVVQSPVEWGSYIRQTQESLRQLAEHTAGIAVVSQRDFEQQLREIQSRDELGNLRDKLREIERAYALASERGPGNPDLAKAQEELARLNDQLAKDEETLRRSVRLAEAAARLEQAEAARRAAQASSQRPLVSPSGKTPVRVSDTTGLQGLTVTKRVDPEHPFVGVSGTVLLEALVDERGNVADARVLRSIPLLDQAALDAVKQWQFRPATLKGEVVPVIVQIEMNFALK